MSNKKRPAVKKRLVAKDKQFRKIKSTEPVIQPDRSPKPRELVMYAEPGKTPDQLTAKYKLNPETLAAFTLQELNTPLFGEETIMGFVDALKDQSKAIVDGDMTRVEEMLVSQASTLNMLFHVLTHKASINFVEYLDAAETYLKLALRAQSQCRATLETLSEIKNPPIFAKQANIAHNQQVNNDVQTSDSTRAGK